jgi:hypothetical protein
MSIEADLPLNHTPSPSPNGDGGAVLVTVDDYDDAVAVIDTLARAQFPVEQVSIVGHGVELVERVTGRFGPARAVVTGAVNGGLIGLFFGLLFDWWGALSPQVNQLWLALDGLAYGALVGAGFTMLFYAFTRGRREFASTRSLTAARYDVVVPRHDRARALGVLDRTAGK